MNDLRTTAARAQNLWRASGSDHPNLKIFAGALAALLAWGIIANFSDIKRYIRISTM
jgi:hypothetical protein